MTIFGVWLNADGFHFYISPLSLYSYVMQIE